MRYPLMNGAGLCTVIACRGRRWGVFDVNTAHNHR